MSSPSRSARWVRRAPFVPPRTIPIESYQKAVNHCRVAHLNMPCGVSHWFPPRVTRRRARLSPTRDIDTETHQNRSRQVHDPRSHDRRRGCRDLVRVFIRIGGIPVAVVLLFLGPISAQWLIFRENRHLAGFCFWVLGTLTNALYAALCVVPELYVLLVLVLGWMLIVAPTVGGLGRGWAILSTGDGVVRRSRSVVASWVFLVVTLPMITLCTLWPLRIAFASAKPTLERLADQAAGGNVIGFPQQAGLFRIVASAVDAASGNVCLFTDSTPNASAGFVRIRPGKPWNRRVPSKARPWIFPSKADGGTVRRTEVQSVPNDRT